MVFTMWSDKHAQKTVLSTHFITDAPPWFCVHMPNTTIAKMVLLQRHTCTFSGPARLIATVQAHNSSNWQQSWQEAQICRHSCQHFISLLLLQLPLQLQTKTVLISKSFEVPVQNSKFGMSCKWSLDYSWYRQKFSIWSTPHARSYLLHRDETLLNNCNSRILTS